MTSRPTPRLRTPSWETTASTASSCWVPPAPSRDPHGARSSGSTAERLGMIRMRALMLAAGTWGLLSLGLAPGADAQAQFAAQLSGAQEVPAVASAGRGTSSLTLTPAGLQFFITVEGLSGTTITQVH